MRQPVTPSPSVRRIFAGSIVAALTLTLSACGGDNIVLSEQAGCELDGTTGGEAVILPGAPGAPEIATGYVPKKAVKANTYMAVTNNPTSTKAACDVLKQGGTAIDAAVAAQMVLNLVEPQSSGIGGGTFILYYDAATKQVISYDGREMAPAAADENYLQWKSATDQTSPIPNAVRSGRSIGTPGTLRVLELAHNEYGRLPWKDLFDPAIKLATDGFPIPPRMAASISSAGTIANIQRDPEMAAYFLNADGSARKVNTLIRNPALGATFGSIASQGADAFYGDGPIARAIVAKIANTYGGTTTAGVTTLADMANYRAKKRTPVCSSYRDFEVCGMPPPSSGGIAVAQILGIIENFDMSRYGPSALDINGGKPSVPGVHLMAEAGNLAYADRNKYVADTDFVALPGGGWDSMINKPYMTQRSRLISMSSSIPLPAAAGDLGPVPLAAPVLAEHGTTHLSLTDRYGNVVSMTTTIESGLGSYHFTNGFLLNNQLTDFSAAPTIDGLAVANRLQAGKRPRSSMAPTLVFKRNADGTRGDFYMATGSPGGATIIQYVAKTLVAALDWKLDAQQAVSMVDFGSNNATLIVGGEHPNIDTSIPAGGLAGDNDTLVRGLRDLGHTVNVAAQSSGLSAIVREVVGGNQVLTGGADPRREGNVLGDTIKR
ncbi:gamma-glutamyltransferase family protein [Actimicrobium sp. CCC2.4]|uniref:gamma-glutamyltransferase family protein n=1 Tax=Actimicrobium sp. CCC2.4 TaxID=3048606 RepID=UPI002AC993DC|nr:gamma-glutamyltransferase family protein [Actimicrobium sp. CCC2.4]MEB0137331.1 gamma-glutamyltransferase family protein [Actimicrobium sp. CCC2.4]WPX31778.1 gamma-glutamyltransferase family protein [Actimicrobium sp. CCC2.4]